jgi:hypothetical protein
MLITTAMMQPERKRSESVALMREKQQGTGRPDGGHTTAHKHLEREAGREITPFT